MRYIAQLFATLTFTLAGCISSNSTQVNNITKNLSFIVHPVQDDRAGYRQAKRICNCAAQKAEKSWNEERLNRFDKELSNYASELAQYTEGFDLEDILPGSERAYPEPSDWLEEQLTDFGEFLAECEDRFGGSGIEF